MPKTKPASRLPVHNISPDPQQPRKRFPEDHIQALAASIKSKGLIQPITVRPWPPDRGKMLTPFMIVAGECRWRAHGHGYLNSSYIDAIIRADLDESTARVISIMENLQRRDMNAMEEARAFKSLIDGGYDIPRVVEELGYKSANYVRSKLDLLTLLPEIQQLLETGNLQSSVAWGIAQAPKQFQRKLLSDHQSGKLDTSEKVRHAGSAIKAVAAQGDIFAKAPRASRRDVEALNGMECRVKAWVSDVQMGFKDGEVIAAQRVNPGRASLMADQIALIRKHLFLMEASLRKASVQGEIRLEMMQ